MDCAPAREAISALLDGERAGVGHRELDAHLVDCAACRRWREYAHEVTRRFRVVAAEGSHAPQDELLEQARAAAPRWRGRNAIALVRGALLVIAIAQLVVTLPALLFGTDHDSPIHVAHEMGSFDAALAVGFVAAALKPERAGGISVIVGAAAALLILTALVDLSDGRTTFLDEAPHLLAVAGWLALRRLDALTSPPDRERASPALSPGLRRLTWPASGDIPTDRNTGGETTFGTLTSRATEHDVFIVTEPSRTQADGEQPRRRAATG